MKYFSIKNWEEYQHGDPNKKHYPWVKLYGALLRRPWMRLFSPELRYWVICLMDFSNENSNKIPEDLHIFCEIYGLKWSLESQSHFLKCLQDNEFICTPKRKVSTTSKREDKTRKEQTIKEFLEFYELYPKKMGRGDAEKAYLKVIKKTTHDEIIKGLNNYINFVKANKTDKKYIKYPSTWLNKGCWADEYELSLNDKPVDYKQYFDVEIPEGSKLRC